MSQSVSHRPHKLRELRQRVILPTRLRAASGWTDACILNVSSRGLLVRAPGLTAKGSTVELWHGEIVIIARVVWNAGGRAGLCTEQPVPIDYIATVAGRAFERSAEGRDREPRAAPRTTDDHRLRARTIQFASVLLIAAAFAASIYPMLHASFARPLRAIEAALGGAI